MKYKNLNSLGRAYRNGEVDRSGYIRQRRDLIDAIVTGDFDITMDTITRLEDTHAEADTIISDASALASRDQENN
ncbi:MAG: hypothetical protein AAF387_12780 [Pseudomonadota bacterium]